MARLTFALSSATVYPATVYPATVYPATVYPAATMQLSNAQTYWLLFGLLTSSACVSAEQAGDLNLQIERGEALYDEHCEGCHGVDGSGSFVIPALIGFPTALPLEPPPRSRSRTGPFQTAEDVFQYTADRMPGDAPGTLSDEANYALVAFLLHVNGLNAAVFLTSTTATQVDLR